jgi:hypothetical protein
VHTHQVSHIGSDVLQQNGESKFHQPVCVQERGGKLRHFSPLMYEVWCPCHKEAMPGGKQRTPTHLKTSVPLKMFTESSTCPLLLLLVLLVLLTRRSSSSMEDGGLPLVCSFRARVLNRCRCSFLGKTGLTIDREGYAAFLTIEEEEEDVRGPPPRNRWG